MKRIVRNYVVRDPKPIMDAIIRGISNYQVIKFKPRVSGQIIFEEIMDASISDEEKTELYINGVRYSINDHYTISEKKLVWGGSFNMETHYDLVFISR